MLLFFPYIVWVAAITSAVLLVVLSQLGELGPPSLAVLSCWFLVAAYLQFGASSDIMGAVGLLLQTTLAVYLILRWKTAGA